MALVMGSLLAVPSVLRNRQQWRIPATTLARGIYGLFGYHFLLFIVLRHAPPVEANRLNSLWPRLMVVLAPLFLTGVKLRVLHVVADLLGFGGAAIATLGARQGVASGGWFWVFLPALASALFWASYCLLTQRVKAFPQPRLAWSQACSGYRATGRWSRR